MKFTDINSTDDITLWVSKVAANPEILSQFDAAATKINNLREERMPPDARFQLALQNSLATRYDGTECLVNMIAFTTAEEVSFGYLIFEMSEDGSQLVKVIALEGDGEGVKIIPPQTRLH